MKQRKRLSEEDIIHLIYNLILDVNTTSLEREVLVDCKNKLSEYKDNEQVILYVSQKLRQLAIKNINTGEKMSQGVCRLYKEIAFYKEWEKNLAIGLSSLGRLR